MINQKNEDFKQNRLRIDEKWCVSNANYTEDWFPGEEISSSASVIRSHGNWWWNKMAEIEWWWPATSGICFELVFAFVFFLLEFHLIVMYSLSIDILHKKLPSIHSSVFMVNERNVLSIGLWWNQINSFIPCSFLEEEEGGIC